MADFFNPAGRGTGIQGSINAVQDLFTGIQNRDDRERLQSLSSGAVDAGFGSQEFKDLAVFSPDQAAKLKSILQTDDQGLDAAFKDAAVFKNLLQNDPTGQSALQFGSQRLQAGSQAGRNMIHTQRFLSEIQADPVEALGSISSFLDIPAEIGKRTTSEVQTANARDWDKFQALIKSDPKKGEQFGRKAGFIRPTEQQKSDIKITESEKKTMAKANIKRKQGFIDSGIEAAKGAANLNRALTLLDGVATGGFDNLALKVKQAFGIEGADEGELSSLMGKAVLAQLKPIFGAAFTASEGESLARLEAQFGRNPKTNKRLIENALKIINRSARRGIAAAEDQNDSFTANEIRESLAFKLSDKDESITQEPQQAAQTINSTVLGRSVSEQDITDTLQANPGLTREQLLQQLGVN